MIVISDTTTITNLIHIDKLNLLKDLYTEIIVPKEVYEELAKLPHQKEIVSSQDWIIHSEISDIDLYEKLVKDLDKGESEAITLAIEKQADLLIIDERKGRKIAKSYGLKIIGLLGILIVSKQKGLIPALKPVLEKLVHEYDFRIHPQLLRTVLEKVGE